MRERFLYSGSFATNWGVLMAKTCIICESKAIIGTCNYCGESVCDEHIKETERDIFCPHCFGQL